MYTFRDIKVDNKYKITYLLSLFIYFMSALFMCLYFSLCFFLVHLETFREHLGTFRDNKYNNEHIVRYLTDKISITYLY